MEVEYLMALSKAKREKLELRRRQQAVSEGRPRPLYDANAEAAIRRYLDTGEIDEIYLPEGIKQRARRSDS